MAEKNFKSDRPTKTYSNARVKKSELEEGKLTPSGGMSGRKLKVSLVDGVLESFKLDLNDPAAKKMHPGVEVDFTYSAEFGWNTGEAKGTSYLGASVLAVRRGALADLVVDKDIPDLDFSTLDTRKAFEAPAAPAVPATDVEEIPL